MARHRQGTAGPPLAWDVARRIAYEAPPSLPARSLPLMSCAGLALAAPLRARTALPPFDVAAMDGYAVAGPGPWRLVGEVLAGAPQRPLLTAGTAVGIATGARVPGGADAVLAAEQASRGEGVVHGAVQPGAHIRRAGEECTVDELLLEAGSLLTAAALGLAAASGHDVLPVRSRPRVAALVTGDELLAEGLPRDARVRDALGPQLPLLVAAGGGELVELAHLRDDEALLHKAVEAADADVVVTTGASSVGAADHLRPVLAALDATLLVDGVACRPGHPQVLARLPDGRFVVGLPGNPLAALVASVTVLGPLLAGLGGRALRRSSAVLADPLRAADAATRLVPVRLEGAAAQPVRHTGSGMLRGAAAADALAVVPPGADAGAGHEVEVLPLP